MLLQIRVKIIWRPQFDHCTYNLQTEYPNSHCLCIADAKARGTGKPVIAKSLIAIETMNIFVGERNDLSKAVVHKTVTFPINPTDTMRQKAVKRHI